MSATLQVARRRPRQGPREVSRLEVEKAQKNFDFFGDGSLGEWSLVVGVFMT